MGTTKEQIRTWLEYGKSMGASHVMVVCDTFDWEDYPVLIMPDQDAYQEFHASDGKNMQKVMEVYDLRLDWDKQLAEHRAFHFS